MRTSPSTGSRIGPSVREPGELLAAGGDVRVTAWCLPPGTAARRARGLLRSQLDGHVSDLAVLDDLDVIVCELATNALRHTGGPCEMRAFHHGGVPVVCEIADCGGGVDRVAAHLRTFTGADAFVSIEALAEGGRGLRIVAALSGGRCGVRTTRLCGTGLPGKSVWFGIPVDRPTGHLVSHIAAAGAAVHWRPP